MNKILVIEDNAEVRENLKEILELSDYEVITAEDGKEGVEMALEQEPDLILCDVMMPKLDGFGVLNILRKKRQTTDTPLIFLTAKTETDDFRRGMNLGADDYLTKPFMRDDLLRVVEFRLQKNERIKNRYDKQQNTWISFIDKDKGYAALKELSEQYEVRQFPRKEVLFTENKFPRHLLYIKKGKVKIYKTNNIGKELILNIQNEGQFIGYSSLVLDNPYNFSAATLEKSEIILIPKDDFLKKFFSDQHVTLFFTKTFAQNIARKEEQLIDLAYFSVRKRVANALLFIHDKYKTPPGEGMHILREDLARLVGTAKESVIRMLTEFKDDGYIDIKSSYIHILNREELENIPG